MREEKRKSKKIFISYGRKDAQDLAFKLEKDLNKQGYNVWLDKTQMEPGQSWEYQIEDAILNAEIFIALLSPHAVRRPNGVCLDEISLARYNERKILPVMVLKCRPPLGIYRLDWIDFQNWEIEHHYIEAFNRLLDALDKKAIVEGYHSRIFSLLDNPLDFGVEIVRFTHDFTGRAWLLRDLNEWIEKEESRVFFLTGDPGIGKSAMLAFLVDKHPQVVAHHFCINNLKDSLDPIRFIKSIAAQLATQLGNYRESLNEVNLEELITISDPSVIFRRIIADPLKVESPNKPLLIVIDGLDEGLVKSSPNIVSVLRERLNDLPKWLRLVLSSRKELEIMDLFSEFSPHEINASRSENLQDIEIYLEIRLREPKITEKILKSGIDANDLVKTIKHKSEGNFLYVINAIKAIEEGLMDPAYPKTFPPGLLGWYKIFFSRLFPKGQDYDNFRPMLDVILAAREPLNAKQISSFLHRSEFEIRKSMQKLASYFPERNKCYHVYHKSLKDWLLGDVGQDLTYQVDLEGGHRFIARYLQKIYKDRRTDKFMLNNLPQHLLALEEWDDIVELLSDLRHIGSYFREGEAHTLIKNYLDVLSSENMPDMYRKKIEEFKQFVINQAHIFRQYPQLTIQQALNQVDTSIPSQTGKELLELINYSHSWIEWVNKPQERDPCILTLIWHSERPYLSKWVSSCKFSPDGSQLIAGSRDYTLRLWDSETGDELRTFTGHIGRVYSCAFSPDGTEILSGSTDNTLKLWDVKTGKEIRSFSGHSDEVSACVFSPNGKVILSASIDKTLKLWNSKSGTEIRTLIGHSDWVRGCDFSPDGTKVISASNDKTLKLWDANTGVEIKTFKGHSGWVYSCAFSPDGTKLLSASDDKTLKLWDVETGEEIKTLSGHSGWVRACAFSPDGTKVLSASSDTTLKLWDVITGREIRTFSGHSGWVESCAYSPDGIKVLSASTDASLKLWDAKADTKMKNFTGHTGWVRSCSLSPDGKRMLSTSMDKIIRLWDIETGVEIKTFAGHSAWVNSCVFSPDSTRMLSASDDETLKLWNIETGVEIRTYTGHSFFVNSCTFSPDGKKFLSSSSDNTLKLWDIDTGSEIRTFKGHSDSVRAGTFSPDGKKILSASNDNTLKLWNTETGAEIKTFKGHFGRVNACAFSPDGTKVLSASEDKKLKLWDVETGNEIRTFSGHSDRVNSCAFSMDCKKILSASDDKTLKFWDAETGFETLIFPTLGWANTLALGKNNLIAVGDSMGWVYILRPHDIDIS